MLASLACSAAILLPGGVPALSHRISCRRPPSLTEPSWARTRLPGRGKQHPTPPAPQQPCDYRPPCRPPPSRTPRRRARWRAPSASPSLTCTPSPAASCSLTASTPPRSAGGAGAGWGAADGQNLSTAPAARARAKDGRCRGLSSTLPIHSAARQPTRRFVCCLFWVLQDKMYLGYMTLVHAGALLAPFYFSWGNLAMFMGMVRVAVGFLCVGGGGGVHLGPLGGTGPARCPPQPSAPTHGGDVIRSPSYHFAFPAPPPRSTSSPAAWASPCPTTAS